MELALAPLKDREALKLEYAGIPALTTEVPVCGLCGSVLTEVSIGLHKQWHEEQDKKS